MARDFFGKGRGPSPANEEIEKEAAREIERLTGGGARPTAFGPGMGGGMGPGVGPQGPSFGASPLEQMAAEISERRTPVRRRRSQRPVEDRAGFKGGGFMGAAANTGSVGSALGFGGGVAPGGRPKPPPPDALPLGYRPPEQYGRGPGVANDDDDDGSGADDDIGVTEMALRDHAERFGRGLEDTMIRSDPAAAENMRELALRQFMDRQSAQPRPTIVRPPAGKLNLRTRPASGGGLRLRPPPEREVVEPDEDVDADEEEATADPADAAADDQFEEEDTPMPAASSAPASPSGPLAEASDDDDDDERIRLAEERARMAEERARVAEDRAQLAEERARLAEERSTYAEARAWSSAKQASEAIERFAELEALLDEAMSAAPPAPAKPTAARKARAVKKAPVKKAPVKRATTRRAPKAVIENDDDQEEAVEAAPRPGPRVGGVLGRRLAEQARRAEARPAPGARPAPAAPAAPAATGPARVVRKAPGAVKRRPARA